MKKIRKGDIYIHVKHDDVFFVVYKLRVKHPLGDCMLVNEGEENDCFVPFDLEEVQKDVDNGSLVCIGKL